MLTAIRVGYAGYQWDGSVNNDRTVSGAMAGLYHVRHRVYDPELGRWTRRDPLGYVDGLNPNEYVGGRVVVGVDPTGKVSFLCLGCIACLVASGGTCGGMCCCGQYWDTPGEGFFSCFDKCIVNVPAGYNYACGSVCTGCRAFPVRTPKAYPPSNPGLRPPLWDKIPRASVELH
jgi:RHS repeat-associated protein